MKKKKKVIPVKPIEEGTLIGPEENIPAEEENPEAVDPLVEDTGNPPPTKPSPVKK